MVMNSPSYRSHLGRTGFSRSSPVWGNDTQRSYPRSPVPPRNLNRYSPPGRAANLNMAPRGFPWRLAPVVGPAIALAFWLWPTRIDPGIQPPPPGTLPGYRYVHPQLPANSAPYIRNPNFVGNGVAPPQFWPMPPLPPFVRWYGRYLFPNPLNPSAHVWEYSGILFPDGRWMGRPGYSPGLSPDPWPGFNPPPNYAPPRRYNKVGLRPVPGLNPAPMFPAPVAGPGRSVKGGRDRQGGAQVKLRNKWAQAFFVAIGQASEGWEMLDIALDVAGINRQLPAWDQLTELFWIKEFDMMQFYREVTLNNLSDKLFGRVINSYQEALIAGGITSLSGAPGGFLSGLAQAGGNPFNF